MTLSQTIRPASALAALAILAASAVPAGSGPDRPSAKPSFDGAWSVLIVTEKGTCDRAYRYPVKIENGSVGYAGSASFTVSGKVGANGAVTVTVAARQPERHRHRPHVGDRRLGHLDRGFAANAPAPGPPSAAPKISRLLSLTSTTHLARRSRRAFFFALRTRFRRCCRNPAGADRRQVRTLGRETESPAPETHETIATFGGNRRSAKQVTTKFPMTGD